MRGSVGRASMPVMEVWIALGGNKSVVSDVS